MGKKPSVMNIALVGGESYCKEILEKTSLDQKEGKGVGLGLSVASGIIQELGGSIRAKSEVEQGSTCIIELPLKQPSGSYD